MRRNLWLVIGYCDNTKVEYSHKTRGLGIPLGVYTSLEKAEEVGQAYAKDESGTFSGPRSFSTHPVKLDRGGSVRSLGDDVFQPTLRALGYPRKASV